MLPVTERAVWCYPFPVVDDLVALLDGEALSVLSATVRWPGW